MSLLLALIAFGLDARTATHALDAWLAHGHSSTLLVAQMTEPSSEARLFVVDMHDPKAPHLILRAQVAHGIGSDPKNTGRVQEFGDQEGSHKTAPGLYKIGPRYQNASGRPAYILDGLDTTNKDAEQRAVVLHPAPYVSDRGYKIGRSWGCPAVSVATFQRLEHLHLDGALLWIDGGQPES